MPTATRAPLPERPPLTPAEQLLARSADPNLCAVTFTGDGISDTPVLEWQGDLYEHLPIPARDGLVFGGWYSTPEDAAAFTTAAAHQRRRRRDLHRPPGLAVRVMEDAGGERGGGRPHPDPDVPPVHRGPGGRERLAARQLRVHRRLRRAYEPHRDDRVLPADLDRAERVHRRPPLSAEPLRDHHRRRRRPVAGSIWRCRSSTSTRCWPHRS